MIDTEREIRELKEAVKQLEIENRMLKDRLNTVIDNINLLITATGKLTVIVENIVSKVYLK